MSSNPSNLAALPAKQTADNGGEFAALLQPKHRATNVATLTATEVTSTTLVATTINGILSALVAAGIMKSS